ncbi:Ankyrin-1 [Apiospora marii]|uniref:Ankyrin-1 n=1 Tax=Apiospora marii TaxID=335849 RepID=A0ABR1S5V6_9PEZI
MAAAKAMLTEIHESLPGVADDSNTYVLGSIFRHNVVIAGLPTDGYGTNNAATVANNMHRSFPSIKSYLLVGVGAGAPGLTDVRLGDVVVGNQVIQTDLGKKLDKNVFVRTSIPIRPSQSLRTAITKLRAEHETRRSKLTTYLDELRGHNAHMTRYTCRDGLYDFLFKSDYGHEPAMLDCELCDKAQLEQRLDRSTDEPRIHYGIIASGNQVVKNATERDQIARDIGACCFEMEAAGLTDSFHPLVIRSICDYADSHKNKKWQTYAAGLSAAYAKELLSVMEPISVESTLESDENNSGCTYFPSSTISVTQAQCLTTAHLRFSNQHVLMYIVFVSSEERRENYMQSLEFGDMDTRRSTIEKAHTATCGWLSSHPTYLDWLDPSKLADHNGLLHIAGKPGAGKSTLMKTAYERLKKQVGKENICLSFFFNARGTDLEKSTIGMYRSLLHQILQAMPDLQVVFDDSDIFPRRQLKSPVWTLDILQDTLAAIVALLGQRPLTCFIDALDECDADQIQDMIFFFEDLTQRAVDHDQKLLICFSSRHYPHVEVRKALRLILEDQTGHSQDLDSYVQSKLRAGKGKIVDEIRVKILQKANGVFLWIVLVVNILNKEFRNGRVFAVKKRLDEIPEGLSDLFRDILRRDSQNLDDLLLCIQWVLFAKQPLRREEFYFALVAGLDKDNLEALGPWDPAEITLEMMDRFISSSSKGLAELTKSEEPTVQFIHESVNDFLLKDGGWKDLWPEINDLKAESHDQLKRCCSAYFQVDFCSQAKVQEYLPADLDIFKRERVKWNVLGQTLDAVFPFLKYATANMLWHANYAAENLPQDEFLADPRLSLRIMMSIIFECYDLDPYLLGEEGVLLYVVAVLGYKELARTLIEKDVDVNTRGAFYGIALQAALEEGNRKIVQMLLKNGADVNTKGGSWGNALQAASAKGYPEIVQMLLENGADVNAKAGGYGNALQAASAKGYPEIVQMLLENGADVNTEGGEYGNALQAALYNGNYHIAKLLQGSTITPGSVYSPRAENSVVDSDLNVVERYRRKTI